MTKYFEDIRIARKIKHDLKETIVVICAVTDGYDSWEVIEDFVQIKLEALKELSNVNTIKTINIYLEIEISDGAD